MIFWNVLLFLLMTASRIGFGFAAFKIGNGASAIVPVEERVTWFTARCICHAKDYELYVSGSSDELEDVISKVQGTVNNNSSEFYIGYHFLKPGTGEWLKDTSLNMTFTNDEKYGTCAFINPSGKGRIEFNSCSSKRYFICESKPHKTEKPAATTVEKCIETNMPQLNYRTNRVPCAKCLLGCGKEGECLPRGCKDGYTGKKCTEQCISESYGYECKQKCKCRTGKFCNHENGNCEPFCPEGFMGLTCQIKECLRYEYGPECSETCSGCEFGCNSTTGVCAQGLCVVPYTGEQCTDYHLWIKMMFLLTVVVMTLITYHDLKYSVKSVMEERKLKAETKKQAPKYDFVQPMPDDKAQSPDEKPEEPVIEQHAVKTISTRKSETSVENAQDRQSNDDASFYSCHGMQSVPCEDAEIPTHTEKKEGVAPVRTKDSVARFSTRTSDLTTELFDIKTSVSVDPMQIPKPT